MRSITGSATLNLRFPGQYFLVESGLHYNWNRHYDPTTGGYIQADPNRDVIATQPVNLDGGTLTARGGISGGSQLPIQIASAGDYNRQIGAELPEFVDGSSVYAYARSSPAMFVDLDGTQTITGFTKHGINQIINRGISPQSVLGTIRNPLVIRPMSNGTVQYKGLDCVIVLNPAGGVVTAWPQ